MPLTAMPTSLGSLLVSLAVLAWLLYGQLRARPLTGSFSVPLILCAVGVAALVSASRVHPMTPATLAILAALLIGDASLLGALRAYTVRLWQDGGRVMRQGTWLTLLLWIAGVAIHVWIGQAGGIGTSDLLLYLGVTLAAQRLVLQARARHLTQVGSPVAREGVRGERVKP